jgi:hypothetical protein
MDDDKETRAMRSAFLYFVCMNIFLCGKLAK